MRQRKPQRGDLFVDNISERKNSSVGARPVDASLNKLSGDGYAVAKYALINPHIRV
ncbi:MAG: hypothetical protein RIC06_10255 [Cyclobacteriaceae bacterium]